MRLAARAGLAISAALLTLGCVPAERAPPAAPIPTPQSSPLGRFTFQGVMTQGGLLLGTAPAGTTSLSLDGQAVEVGRGGRFLVGFGREAASASVLEAIMADGRRVRETLRISPRQWDVQSIPTLARGTTPTPEFLARRKIELARIDAARALRNSTDGWEQPFLWPVAGRISGVFGSQRIYAGEPGAPHSGVDIARPTGTTVAAPADGVVVLATETPFTLEGNLLMIDHGMGLNSAFLHLSRIDVRHGQRVVRGQPVGAIGMTGRATGPHLHWGMMWRGVRVDPQLLVGPMPTNP